MKRYIIYLDIDGVLNNTHPRNSETHKEDRKRYDGELLHKYNMDYFKQLVDYILENNSESKEVKFIISSTWRSDMDNTIKSLNKCGTNIESIVLGATDLHREYSYDRWTRGEQIARSVFKYRPDGYIILDDDIYDIYQIDRLIHIDRVRGLDEEYLKQIKEKLNKFYGSGKDERFN